VERALEALSALSFVAHRDALDALPALQHHGEDVVLRWLDAARRLFEHDREAGKAFIRGSRDAEKVSETVLSWTGQALAFLQWPAPAPAVEGFMKNLPRAFGSLGHAGERRWAEIGLLWYSRHAESGRAYFAAPVLDLASRQGITGIEQLCTPLEELYESRKLMLVTVLAGAVRVRNLLGAQAILPWAARGADILQSGRARGEAYFRLESEESLSVLLDHLPGFRMSERNRLLSLLLDIWYERQFELRESSWSPEKGRPFVETDGRTVFIPAVMPDRDEAILAVLHAAGHLAFGGFDRAALQTVFSEAGSITPSWPLPSSCVSRQASGKSASAAARFRRRLHGAASSRITTAGAITARQRSDSMARIESSASCGVAACTPSAASSARRLASGTSWRWPQIS